MNEWYWALAATLIALFASTAAVFIFRPLSKRVGEMLEQMHQDREKSRLAHDDLGRLTDLVERMSDRLDGIDERLDFTERVLASPERPANTSPKFD